MVELPAVLSALIRRYQRGGVSAKTCSRCPSLCCSQGGFALLENVLLIYDLYRKGRLERADYVFEPGLAFDDFVFTYFDVWTRKIGGRKLVMFHMKNLGPGGNLVSVPDAGDYWEIREALFGRNPWMSRGCVFLSRELPGWMQGDGKTVRHCILHNKNSATRLTAKPLDCVFHTCVSRMKSRRPSRKIMERWFRALAKHFPDSLPRFNRMIK